jgi:hypothetical protein
MRDFSGNVQTTASATNDVQSGVHAVAAVSSSIEPLKLFNSIANEIANVLSFISTMYVADLDAQTQPNAKAVTSIFTYASRVRLFPIFNFAGY